MLSAPRGNRANRPSTIHMTLAGSHFREGMVFPQGLLDLAPEKTIMISSETALKTGDTWQSKSVNHGFVVDGGEETWPGLHGWAKERFTGIRARRKGDGRLALICLTAKPPGYPYDYVLFD